jgi:nicotinate-nucleotide pyrophosphorylase (carboxylating)
VSPGDHLAVIEGSISDIITGERIALNFLQHLSGVATLTRKFVDAVAGLSCKILDTRKTTPGWRLLEKYAVRAGGGTNHRLGLYDAVLIKDSHLAALGLGKEAFKAIGMLMLARRSPDLPTYLTSSVPWEIEVETLEQFSQALACQPDIIMLDNMPVDQLREAVRQRTEAGFKVQLEASGGITLGNVRGVAETGIDRISIGALTHSAPALDIALDYDPVP